MDIEGSLEVMNLPDLVQFFAHEGQQAYIQVENNGCVGKLYLDDGLLCHAELQLSAQERLTGDEVVYELLTWQSGKFKIQKKVQPPEHSLAARWDFLLLEGLRQIDERRAVDPEEPDETAGLLSNLSESDARAIQKMIAQQEARETMASKSEQLQNILNAVVSGSSDIVGAVIVDKDGLLLASALNGKQDSHRVAAVTAGLISLAGRSAHQLNQGEVHQTLIQAANGNIVALRAGSNAAFVALTPSNANLGMTFMECRDAAGQIASVL